MLKYYLILFIDAETAVYSYFNSLIGFINTFWLNWLNLILAKLKMILTSLVWIFMLHLIGLLRETWIIVLHQKKP